MRIRIMKLLLVIAAGLQATIYALQNLANIDAAYAAVAYVLSNADHEVYANSIMPAITSPTLIWLAVGTIIFLEMTAGLMALAGAVRMSMSVNGTMNAWNASKRLGIIGLGLMVFVWLGLFLAIGGALFQMWQTEIGLGSLEGAFIYAVTSGLVLAIVAQDEPPHADQVPHARETHH